MVSRANAAPAGLQLGNAPAQYDQQDQQGLRSAIVALERRLAKIDAEARMQRLCLQDVSTGVWYQITVNAGVVTLVAIT